MAAAYTLAQLRPYLAPVLLEATGTLQGQALLTRLLNETSAQLRGSSSRGRRIIRTTDVDTADALLTQAILYRETGSPSWLPGPGLEDVAHELIVLSVRGTHATLCASSGPMRDRLVKKLKAVRRMPRDAIAAFVGDEAKALWLNGVHTPTAAKADTKALTGVDLGYSLDPIGDQSYYYSAVRSIPDIPALAAGAPRPPLIGAAPGGGRIWIRRAESLEDYRAVINAALDNATTSERRPEPFQALAQPTNSAEGVEGAYAISIIPEELLSEDDIPRENREAARRWAFDAHYAVTPRDGMALSVAVTLGGIVIGTAELGITLDEEGEAQLGFGWSEQPPEAAAARAECEGFLGNLGAIKIYYESGHTLAQARCYAGGFTDQPFDWRFDDFSGYDVDTEKPAVPKGKSLAQCIAADGDTSLFAFTCQKMFVDADGAPHGWLASDDGSMELADFIHIDPDAKVLTLVHIKASGSTAPDRMAAPAEYEVVVSQAVKNLRHLDRRNLADELKRGKAKKIGAAVWHNGDKQKDRTGFLAAAEKLPRSATRKLIVLQPRVTCGERKRCLADGAPPSHAMRMKQIETLMLAARASALACGASFEGIADGFDSQALANG